MTSVDNLAAGATWVGLAAVAMPNLVRLAECVIDRREFRAREREIRWHVKRGSIQDAEGILRDAWTSGRR